MPAGIIGEDMSLEIVVDVIQIIFADIVLSGDNALVIGMAAAGLSAKLRKRAIFIGMALAAGLRILFAITATYLLAIKGILLVGAALQLLIGEARSSHHLAQRFLLRSLQRRTLRLVRDDLASAANWELDPDVTSAWPCPLGRRQPLLAIHPRNGGSPVVYSLGAAPSPIWRGTVLMRCGPAVDLRGQPSASGQPQSRVVLDAVEAFKLTQQTGSPVLLLELEQQIDGRDQRVRSKAVG